MGLSDGAAILDQFAVRQGGGVPDFRLALGALTERLPLRALLTQQPGLTIG